MALMPSLPGFIFTEKLGKGSFATVYKAYRIKPDKREVVAIKCVLVSSLTKSSVENLITEISILKKVKHEFIVELIDFQWDSTYIYLILEYCSGGDLSHFIRSKKRLPEIVVHKFLQQLATALKVLRSHNIAHMDLKPQNILLSDKSNPVLKLGDFGLAQKLQSDDEATSFRGSPLYMAPEILLKHHYDASVDLWSVGIILYECLFGQAPFSSRTFAELAEKIKKFKDIELPIGAQVSDKCRELLLGLLKRNPNKRMKFEEFFNHPYLDLEHMPTKESYDKGVMLVQQAVKADAEMTFDKAIQSYCEALDYLVPHIQSERDPNKRREFRKKLMEYLSRAEELKKLSQKELPVLKTKEATTYTKEATTNIKEATNTESIKIDDIIASEPNLKRAVFFAQQADALMQDRLNEEANEFYHKALEIMVPAVSNEPPGLRKELLYAETSKWMKKAEDLKSILSLQRQEKKLARMKSLETFQDNKPVGNSSGSEVKTLEKNKLKARMKKCSKLICKKLKISKP